MSAQAEVDDRHALARPLTCVMCCLDPQANERARAAGATEEDIQAANKIQNKINKAHAAVGK